MHAAGQRLAARAESVAAKFRFLSGAGGKVFRPSVWYPDRPDDPALRRRLDKVELISGRKIASPDFGTEDGTEVPSGNTRASGIFFNPLNP